jgi:hypothetical protein
LQHTAYVTVGSALEATPFLQKTFLGMTCGGHLGSKRPRVLLELLEKNEPTFVSWRDNTPAAKARLSINRYTNATSEHLFVVQNDVTLWGILDIEESEHLDVVKNRWESPEFLLDVDAALGIASNASCPRWACDGLCRIVDEILALDPAFDEIVDYMFDRTTYTVENLIEAGLRPYDCKLQTFHMIWYHARKVFAMYKTAEADAAECALLLEMGGGAKTKVKRNKRAPKAEEAAALPPAPLPTVAAATKALKLLEAEYAAASKAARTAVAAVSIGSAAAKEVRVARKVAAEQAQRVAKGKLDRAKHQLKQALAAPPAAASGRREPMDVQELVARLDALAGRAHRLEPDAGGAAGGASGGDHFEADAALARAMQAELVDSDEFDTSCSVCLDAEPTVSSACCANIQVCAECAAKLRTCLQCRCEGVVFVAL